jgi:hypothetical protein
MSDANAPIAGGCACKRVRYVLTQAPLAVRTCWCRECQYLAAGNGSVNLRIPRAAVQLDGTLAAWSTTAASGNTVRRSFCAACGTPVISESSGSPDIVVIRVGTLDDPSAFPPRATIWSASAPPWACIDASLPNSPRQPT